MGILDEDVQRVRETSDIVAVMSEHVQLKRVGRRWTGLCPFHQEKTPSFNVNQELGLYRCWGCGVTGDVITFVREIEHLDFPGAVELLAAKAGVTLRYTDQQEGESRKRKAKLIDAVGQAAAWYHARLLSSADAGQARGYLRERGLDGDTVRTYQIGWAPDAWDELARSLRAPNDVFVDSGLGFLNSRNKQTDFFRGRVLFPIFDVNGDPVGFGARKLPDGDGPKYKNSPESRIYAKSRLLYGLNWAKAAIVAENEAVVCEGYTDVIGLASAGISRAVATCGTALTEDHVRILKSFAGRVVLAFDADAAGQNAADRFYAWERQYAIDVAVAALPAGVDPGELSRRDPAALQDAIQNAVPFLQFRVNRTLDGLPLSTAEQRARAAEAALAVIAEHPNELVRDQYVMDVASRTRLDPNQLRSRVGRVPRSGLGSPARPSGVPGHPAREGPEVEALRFLVERRDEIEPWLHESLFGDPVSLDAYHLMVTHDDPRAAIGSASGEAADLLGRAVVGESDAEPMDVVVRLLQEAVRRTLSDLELAMREPEDVLAHAHDASWLKLRMEELDDPHRSVEAAEQLLAWLSQQPGAIPQDPRGLDE
ncbi:MAG: DNA primase [Actinobacteria bacterium]|nr:DNA primase [Actinomycetota bacterium]